MFDPYNNIEKLTLSNGIDVYLCSWPVDFTRIIATIHAGHNDNPLGKEGVAHLTEHVAAGTCKMKSKTDLADLLGLGYALGSTSDIATWIEFTTPNSSLKGTKTAAYLKRILSYIDDYFFNIIGKDIKNVFEEEKIAIINECYHRDKSPEMARKMKKINHEPWGELNFMRREYPDTIEQIKIGAVRDFIKKHYTTRNMSIIIVGGLNIELVKKRILASPLNRRFASGTPKRIDSEEKIQLGIPTVFHSRINASDFGSSDFGQAQISMKLLTTKHHNPAMRIARSILYKRLMKELREKRHLTYSVDMNVKRYQNIIGFNLSTRVPKENLDEIESIIEEQILLCAESLNEIKETKKLVLASWRILNYDIFQFTKDWAGEIQTYGKPFSLKERYDKFKNTKPEEVSDFLRYFAEKQNRFTVIVHP